MSVCEAVGSVCPWAEAQLDRCLELTLQLMLGVLPSFVIPRFVAPGIDFQGPS